MRRKNKGFSLIEVMITMLIVSIVFLSTILLISFSHVSNSLEQERSRAHQIIFQEMEKIKSELYSRIKTGQDVTVWDNGTPLDLSDDTTGKIEVEIRDPITKDVYLVPPVPAKMVEVEVTLTWNPRRYSNKTLRETACIYQAP